VGIPEVVLFLVCRHGDVEMLQWCLEQCELVLYDGEGCGKGPSGSSLPREIMVGTGCLGMQLRLGMSIWSCSVWTKGMKVGNTRTA